jgi:hypothetical protein
LSENPSKWAYKLLKNKQYTINWNLFSANPYICKSIKTSYKLFDDMVYLKN